MGDRWRWGSGADWNSGDGWGISLETLNEVRSFAAEAQAAAKASAAAAAQAAAQVLELQSFSAHDTESVIHESVHQTGEALAFHLCKC